MDIFFQDPTEIPLPPAEVRIRQFTATPWPDGRRVKIYLEVEPFQKRPSAEVLLLNAAGDVAAQATVIESMVRKMEFNLHLRQAEPGAYLAQVELFYQPAPSAPPDEGAPEPAETPRQTVDRAEADFEIG